MMETAQGRSAAEYWRARAREHLDFIETFRVSGTTEEYHRAEAAFCLGRAETLGRAEDAGR